MQIDFNILWITLGGRKCNVHSPSRNTRTVWFENTHDEYCWMPQK